MHHIVMQATESTGEVPDAAVPVLVICIIAGLAWIISEFRKGGK